MKTHFFTLQFLESQEDPEDSRRNRKKASQKGGVGNKRKHKDRGNAAKIFIDE